MNRLGTLFWLTLATATLFTMFAVKYTVQNLETSLAHIRRQTVRERLEIHDLHAEWSYLTQPERLAALNRQYLSLVPETPAQLEKTIADIPLRVPPPAAVMVAETAPAMPGGLHLPGGHLAVTPVSLDTSDRARPLPAAHPIRAARALDRLFAQVAGRR